MPRGIAVLNTQIKGTTSGEHSGHKDPHSPSAITGKIISGCSSTLTINSVPVAVQGCVTQEQDSCCGTSSGSITDCSSFITVDGKGVVLNDHNVNAHNGTAKVFQPDTFVSEGV